MGGPQLRNPEKIPRYFRLCHEGIDRCGGSHRQCLMERFPHLLQPRRVLVQPTLIGLRTDDAESELPRDRVEPHERLIVAINPAKLARGIDFPPDQAELVQRIDRRVAVCFRYC